MLYLFLNCLAFASFRYVLLMFPHVFKLLRAPRSPVVDGRIRRFVGHRALALRWAPVLAPGARARRPTKRYHLPYARYIQADGVAPHI